MPARELPQATHPYTRTLWTCRPDASTYGQMLPTLDRTQDFTEAAHGVVNLEHYRSFLRKKRRCPPPAFRVDAGKPSA
jgi:ABC-type dipeptide/oligopeptide/nickel transport system ATPase component